MMSDVMMSACFSLRKIQNQRCFIHTWIQRSGKAADVQGHP